jgi:hypothetical protein
MDVHLNGWTEFIHVQYSREYPSNINIPAPKNWIFGAGPQNLKLPGIHERL